MKKICIALGMIFAVSVFASSTEYKTTSPVKAQKEMYVEAVNFP